ncbi:MAG TPA: acyltransferase family protein [Stellaceae bacterium]|nr:acyltransferase family protein [Stellaceae bacterium]
MERYRPDIDGLRAVAVVAVIIFHAFPASLPGGFLGVDVFFVVSGYLISQLIIEGIRAGRFSLAGFYARRIRRLLPALVVVLAAVFAIGWALLLPNDFEGLCDEIIAGALFFANFKYLSEVGYFDHEAVLKPLLHLWSLGVEEQFYLTWPLFLLLFRARRARSMVVIIGLASWVAALLLDLHDPATAFFLPVSRFWELMIGAALAAGANPVPAKPLWRGGMACAGLLLVLTSFALSPQQLLPTFWKLLPTVGTAFLIASGPRNPVNARVLSNRSLVYVGKISYPLYLWHWPLLSFLAISSLPEKSAIEGRLLVISAAVVLAVLTYRLVEVPMRFGRLRPVAVPVLCVALFVCAGLGGLGSFLDGFPERFPEPIRGYLTVKADWGRADARLDTCFLRLDADPRALAPFCYPSNGPRPVIWVWGDSHAGRLYIGIRKEFTGPIGELIRGGCSTIPDLGDRHCIEGNNFIMSLIRENPPDTLIMFAVWNDYLLDDPAVDQRLIATIEQVRKAGVRKILVVGPAPQWKIDLPRALYEEWRATGTIPDRLRRDLVPEIFSTDRILKEIIAKTPAEYVSLTDALCDERGCLARVSDGPQGLIAFDYGHMTEAGARYVARLLRDGALRAPASAGAP